MPELQYGRSQSNRAVSSRLNAGLGEADSAVGRLRAKLAAVEDQVLAGFTDDQKRSAQRAALDEHLRRGRAL